MSSDYNNPTPPPYVPPTPPQPAPLPPVEQIQVKKTSSGVNIPTFIVSLLVVAALAGGAGWFLGSSSGYSSAQSDFRNNPQSFIQSSGATFGGFGAGGAGGARRTGTPGAGGGGFGGGANNGKITAINGNTITLETANSTITVNMDSNTKITKVDTGATSDLHVGDRILVQGPTNGNAVTATNIILGNITGIFGGRGGGGAGTGNGTGTGNGNGG